MGAALLLALAAVTGSAQADTAPAALTLDAVNHADATSDWSSTTANAGVLRAQVLLERARFSPGEIDARVGANLHRALSGFQASHDLDASGKMDAATWRALSQDDTAALTEVTLTDADVAGPFKPLPAGMAARAKLDALGYTSALEALGERFHASPALLKKLNPEASFDKAGTQLVVPNLDGMAPLPAVAKVVVDKSDSTVSLLDESGSVLAQYPASTGSKHDPLPLGKWKIKGVGRHPTFHYNPKLFWDSEPGDNKATLPAGPNNPVGVVWIDLSKEHYGIHGTPEPAHSGKTESHGCIRMTNWSAHTVSEAVKPGMAAILQE
jgi:lipoprotein-anchoring transpeptidase ErfK/SrfK